LWVPYVLNRCQVRGLGGAMANPSRNDKPLAEWANRLLFAHDNAVENLVVFAPLVLIDLSGRIDLIVDGGPVSVGVESTIVGCFETPLLLRPGGLPREDIERVLGEKLARVPEDNSSAETLPLAPGMLASHYAPRTPVRLNAHRLEAGEALLAFGPRTIPGSQRASVMNLSEAGDLVEAAANLFGYLRELDARGYRAIAVMAVPNEGLGEAINDRLQRAAVPRS
ncbi:MAG: hypothetical protein G4V63_23950, partial [Candidatus Afipia apatlaquensis]|nr:hypothetical protein [Candidatus Afipia apatlaquensis]